MTADDKLVIHQYQVSPFAAKVRRCLHFKQVPFEVINYGLSGVGRVRKLSAAGKAPVLEHNGRMIADSSDIVRYLEDRFPEKPVFPADADDRALAHVFEDWADESLYYYDLTMRSWPRNATWLADDLVKEDRGALQRLLRYIAPKLVRSQARGQGLGRKPAEEVCRDAARHFEAIDRLVCRREWLVGDGMSIADIAVASMLTVLDRAQEASAMMAEHAALADWRSRVDALTLPAGTPENDRALV